MARQNRSLYPPQRSYQTSYNSAPSYPPARGPPPPRQQQGVHFDDGWDTPVGGGYNNSNSIGYCPSPVPSYQDSYNRPPRDAYREPFPPSRNEYGGSGQAGPMRWSSSGYGSEPSYPPCQARSPPRRMDVKPYPPPHAAQLSAPRARRISYTDWDAPPEKVNIKYTLKQLPAPPQPPAPPRTYDWKDLSTSIIYCCRPIDHRAFMALPLSTYPHLELHFVPSLAELEAEIREADLAHPDSKPVRRRCFVTPVGGSDDYVTRVRKEMEGVALYWLAAITVEMLEEELEKDEAFVASKDPDLERPSTSNGSRDSMDHRNGAEEDSSARRRRNVPLAPVAERAKLQAIERHETDNPSSTVLALEEAAAGMEREEGEIVDSATSSKAFSGGGYQEDGSGSIPASSRKRSRRDSEESKQSWRRDGGDGAEQAHKAAKALEFACKKPRRSCNDWALKNGVPIDEATRKADDEPILGERHRGIWDLYGEPLHHLAPQIQVLMARALRDAAQPARLQLYDHPEAFQQLTQAAPWFLTLLEPLKNKPDPIPTVAQPNSTAPAHNAEAWAQDPLPTQLSGGGLDVGDLSF
ncbi:hypothetical protein BCR35DRAFT_336282 [Leucosporidium creatinivorum]|uniref:Uncharacterized protein n=1 Tax=Leucosporidium creatinivorum TaxID=106004 RepID=A0A1Y2CFE7_9BASI|nr:hypothetical protein BCR35DRAFT_336282 [Leucosporidium creatinivorum]